LFIAPFMMGMVALEEERKSAMRFGRRQSTGKEPSTPTPGSGTELHHFWRKFACH
jgi:hypothetical protein